MKGLDGSLYAFNTSGGSKDQNHKTTHQKRAEELIRRIYPTVTFMSEVTAHLDRKTWVRLDIFITAFRLAIEIDGAQHDEYIPFFHGNKINFVKAKMRDRMKEEWCALNGIELVRLKANERDGVWEQRLRSCVGKSS